MRNVVKVFRERCWEPLNPRQRVAVALYGLSVVPFLAARSIQSYAVSQRSPSGDIVVTAEFVPLWGRICSLVSIIGVVASSIVLLRSFDEACDVQEKEGHFQ